MNSFNFEESNLNDQEFSASNGVEFEFAYHYYTEEAGCDQYPGIMQFSWEAPLAIFAALCFFVLGIYITYTGRYIVPRYNGKSIFLLLLLTRWWKYSWGSVYQFFFFINFGRLYIKFIHLMLSDSQSGYGKSKYETRRRNARKAAVRKDRARREREARIKETEDRQCIRENNHALVSQSGMPKYKNVGFTLDLSDWTISNFKEHWSTFRQLMSDFHLNLPEISVPDFAKYWVLIRESEVFLELHHILRMLVTLGYVKKFDIAVKGISLIVTDPLSHRVTALQLIEKSVVFGKLVLEKAYTAYTAGNIDLFFQTEAKNAYDDEYTFIKSQKTRVDLGQKAEVDDETYDRRVSECIGQTLSILNTCKAGERAYFSSRLSVLRDIETSRTLSKKECIRIKPYGMLFTGDSGVGKSGQAEAMTGYVLQVNDFDYSPRARITLNMEDRYQSEFASFHKGVVFDDICNSNLERTEGNPVLPVIMFLNNTPMAALNANADMKGKVMIEPMVVTATTNVKDLMSNQLSNEPLSINRRFESTITQTVKPEFRKPGTTMIDTVKVGQLPGQFQDFATYTIEEPRYREDKTGNKFASGKTKHVTFIPRVFEGKELVDVDVTTLLRFLKADSEVHFTFQKAFVEKRRKLGHIPLCNCKLPVGLCTECLPLESQSCIPYFDDVVSYLSALEIRVVGCLNAFLCALIVSPFGSAIIAYMMREQLKAIIVNSIGYYLICVAVTLMYDTTEHVYGSWMLLLFTTVYLLYVSIRLYVLRRSVINRFTNIPLPSQYIRNMSWNSRMKIVYFLMTVGVWKILVLLVKKWKQLPIAQAAKPITLEPDAKPWQKVTEFWDAHARERQYLFGDAGVSEKSRTISKDDLTRLISKKLMVMEKSDGEFCNVIPLRSNMLLLPHHVVRKETEFVTLTKVGGHTFKGMPLDSVVATRVPGTDFAIWYCPGAGLHKDIIDYYPKDIDEGKKVTVSAIYNDDGTIIKFPSMTAMRSRIITTRGGMFQGYKYTFPEETFGGLCMATLIGDAQGIPFIAGHHLAGKGNHGAAGVVTRKLLLETIERLGAQPCVLESHSAVPMHTSSMECEFGPLTQPHDKCVTNDLALTSRIRIHGGHNGKTGSTPTSSVVTSLISESVKNIMQIEKKHGPPKEMASRAHKELDIAGKVDTATEFDSTLLTKAVIDYETNLAKIPQKELAKVGKISDDVNLAGLDGVLGINAMNFSTSVGFPRKGPKTQFVEKSNRVVDGISCPRDVDPMILDEIAKMEAQLRTGKQINAPFKASLKDEPTKLTKTKVRVFAAANMPFVMLVRKYFLSLAALVQRNKIATECAVGTIVQSPEWTDLFRHIGKHGWERGIAGDYAKFDGRMSPQFMLAAFKMLIKLAEKSGNYEADDLIIMRGIATEISYPTYDYFGTLVQFTGSNPSGHPLTVVINSFVNSLYLRYCWYAIAKEKRWFRTPLFATKVSAMTYGDDNIMTVAKGYDDFNHTAIAEQLAKVSITYTMADKEAKSVPFIPLQSASFLKHYAVWDDELGLFRSPVEEDSIAKMLHTHLKSSILTMEQSSAEAIQNVALKYFEFGREVYTLRKAQLEEVARAAGIQGYVGPIMDYEERLAWYREKFDL